jgi:hypothetical protein
LKVRGCPAWELTNLLLLLWVVLLPLLLLQGLM